MMGFLVNILIAFGLAAAGFITAMIMILGVMVLIEWTGLKMGVDDG